MFNDLISWLFEKAHMKPQLGFAGLDKRAWAWLPSRSMPNYPTLTRAMQSAPIKGATQLAYEDWFKPMAGQRCEICWVGLDIDAEDNPATDLTAINWPECSMVRTSCSGAGIHLIYRLAEPVSCTHETAGRIVKVITAPLVDALGTIRVCKADRRMFWLVGAKNQVLRQSDYLLTPPTIEPVVGATAGAGRGELVQPTPLIADWCGKLGISEFRKSTPVYVGHVVELLRTLGETVKTQSQCRGNGQLNGFIDLTPTSISLFAYADGHTIWNFTDVEAILL